MQGRRGASIAAVMRCDGPSAGPALRQSYHGRRYPPKAITYPWGGVASLKRGLMLQKLLAAHKAGQFFGQHTHLAERKAFAACWRASNVQADNRTLKELPENFRGLGSSFT